MYKFLLPALAFLVLPQETAAQCLPQLLNCNAPVQSCDLSNNHQNYWNNLAWWDNANQSHDLAETKIDLNFLFRDTCGGPDSLTTVRCLLFLDLDGDGVRETVVDSDNPPAPGVVNFDNAQNPNYTGGTPRPFDQRPVPANFLWSFQLASSSTGDSATYTLKWVNEAAPGLTELPELPYGFHKVRWIVTNNGGGTSTCEKTFVVKDCKAPTVVCLNGLSVNIMPTQMIQLWASDFLQYTEDNVTPGNLIKIGIRKSGTGVGFPVDVNGNPITSVIFNCDELGPQEVELWAIDAAGNTDYCLTYVHVLDNLGNCGAVSFIETCATDACAIGLEDVVFEFSSPNLPFPYWDLGACGSFNDSLPNDIDVTITPSNDDNPLNGVTNFDLVIMAKHITGVDLFDTPYQWIGADANNDKIVDSMDILECRKLILGIYTELPNNQSWRFVDAAYSFPTPDPLSAPFPETITVNTSNLPPNQIQFVGVKICDVTCGNIVGFYDIEPEEQHLIGAPQPNPSSDGAMLPLQLLGAENVVLEVVDLAGKLLHRTEMRLPSGPAMLEIPASAMPAAGVYVWRVRAGDVEKAGKLVRY